VNLEYAALSLRSSLAYVPRRLRTLAAVSICAGWAKHHASKRVKGSEHATTDLDQVSLS